ncbi:MAG TPA: 2-keto-4-pentenoate hydratase [Steroidobacter sp.]|uniref:2-keto-4-pentenoate hydratase n=1 Tax=Steroidobacter sp. TaxID=1978227 RepID=UPI002ED8FBFE
MISTEVPEIARQCAAQLAQSERIRKPGRPLTERYPQLTLAEAYAVQQLNIEHRLQGGERIVGHKIGLTAKAMQQLFGVNEPDYGHLLDTMVHDAARPLDLSELIDPQIEVEPAFVLAKPLRGPNVTLADVLDATDYLCVSLEVIDSRIENWRIKLQDTVADNGSSARVVLGSAQVKAQGLLLDDLITELEVDGKLVETSNTREILGHPANGIAWLANAIAPYGGSLQAGHVVLPGSCTKAYRLRGHRKVTARIAGLGEVTLALANEPARVGES